MGTIRAWWRIWLVIFSQNSCPLLCTQLISCWFAFGSRRVTVDQPLEDVVSQLYRQGSLRCVFCASYTVAFVVQCWCSGPIIGVVTIRSYCGALWCVFLPNPIMSFIPCPYFRWAEKFHTYILVGLGDVVYAWAKVCLNSSYYHALSMLLWTCICLHLYV